MSEPPRAVPEGPPTVPAEGKPLLRELLESIVVVVILTLFIRTWIFQAFEIPTGSMEPNLLVGDHLLVNKLAYSPSLGAFEPWLLGKRELARGDVVVFKYPQDPRRDYIKRVIGLAGETVEVRGKQVLVDGVALSEPYARFPEPAHEGDAEGTQPAATDGFGPTRVPTGELFVLGDNRDRSRDSRSWGFLPRDQVKGRALIVYWSHPGADAGYHRAGFLQYAAFGDARFDRLGLVIR